MNTENDISGMIGRIAALQKRKPIKIGLFFEKFAAKMTMFFASFFPDIINRKCLFSCLILLDWMHKKGIDPIINVGLRKSSNGEMEGHSWLSISDFPFCENSRLSSHYTIAMSQIGKIKYWFDDRHDLTDPNNIL